MLFFLELGPGPEHALRAPGRFQRNPTRGYFAYGKSACRRARQAEDFLLDVRSQPRELHYLADPRP